MRGRGGGRRRTCPGDGVSRRDRTGAVVRGFAGGAAVQGRSTGDCRSPQATRTPACPTPSWPKGRRGQSQRLLSAARVLLAACRIGHLAAQTRRAPPGGADSPNTPGGAELGDEGERMCAERGARLKSDSRDAACRPWTPDPGPPDPRPPGPPACQFRSPHRAPNAGLTPRSGHLPGGWPGSRSSAVPGVHGAPSARRDDAVSGGGVRRLSWARRGRPGLGSGSGASSFRVTSHRGAPHCGRRRLRSQAQVSV